MRVVQCALALLPAALVACPTTPTEDSSGIICTGDVCTVTGPILEDTTFTADKQWVLVGGVFVGDDSDPSAAPTTLTIEPGTTIFGDTASLSFLLITRGSRIVADGTEDAPIVFTSAGDVGARVRGHWGGLVINGQAPVNGCAGDPCTLQGEAGTGTYGGADVDDDSGVIRYVRIEFPGKLIDDENELNGIALQGVGRGTTVDFVQVHMGADDCIEFFGGTVDAKHVVCTGMGDDNLDWTFGWTGRLQFLVAQQAADAGERGIEADNNEDNFALAPISDPVISHMTLIGNGTADGVKLRRGTRASIHNAVIAGFSKCVDIDDADTFAHGEAGDIVVHNSIFDCNDVYKVKGDDPETEEDESDPAGVADIFAAILDDVSTGNSSAAVAAVLIDAENRSAPDFRVKAGGPATTGAVRADTTFFDDVAFVGAVGDTDWTAGWTAFPLN